MKTPSRKSPVRAALVACLLGVAVAVPAIAQTGSVSQYPSCPDPPPKISQAELDAAHAAFTLGSAAYNEGDYQKAVDDFKEAFRRDCTKVQLLAFIARAYEAKGDKAEAVHALEVYLQRNPKADDSETVKRRIENLKAQMQAASATSATAAATTPTATVTATTSAVPTTTATEQPSNAGGHTVVPWIVTGVGGVALVTGVVVLLVGKGKVDLARNGCAGFGGTTNCLDTDPVPTDPTHTRKELSTAGANLETIGWIVGGVGLAAVVGGLVWHFVEPTGKRTALAPTVGPNFAGLSLSGSF